MTGNSGRVASSASSANRQAPGLRRQQLSRHHTIYGLERLLPHGQKVVISRWPTPSTAASTSVSHPRLINPVLCESDSLVARQRGDSYGSYRNFEEIIWPREVSQFPVYVTWFGMTRIS